jgi:hypothetical protein
MAMSVVEDIDKLIWEVERPPPLYKKMKEYSARNLKDKLWHEVASKSSRIGVSYQLNRNQKNVC